MDLERWKALGLQEAFAEKQSRIIQLFSNMGISTTCSCIPYETPNAVHPISLGDHLAWGESNAVIYANSLIGARTNRESGISSLASAIAGLTPNYGLHTEEGRMPTLEVRVEGELTHLQYDLLGAYIGNRWNSEVCAFSGLTPPMDNGDLKHLGAALAAKGGHGIFHISGLTPEGWMLDAARSRGAIKEVCSLDAMELEAHKDELYPPPQVEPDAYVLGCPQFGLSEFGRLARAVKGKRLRKDKRIMVFTSRDLRAMVAPDIIRDIEAAGIEVYNDTCMVVTPLRELGICRVGTDSGKAAHYIPKMSKVETELVPLELIVERCT